MNTIASAPLTRALDSSDAVRIANELDEAGFACLPGIISDQWLQDARGQIQQMIERHGARYFSLLRPADDGGSFANTLLRDPDLARMLRELSRHAVPDAPFEESPAYNVLRVIAGPNGAANSLEFHYDATVVTALVPIFMPKGPPQTSGELVVFPNRRGYRATVLGNILEKIVVQSGRFRRRMARQVDQDPGHRIRLLEPGNIYFFWGYRTYHGNLPCAPNSLRATLLIHEGNPHGRSPLLKLVKAVRKVREERNLRRAGR